MSWFRTFFRRGDVERELDRELQFHLDARVADLIKSGRMPGEALREALVEFGGVEQAKEGCRDERGGQWLETLRCDFVFAWRQLWKAPGLTATIVMTLALGIGGFATISSVIHGLMIDPRDFPAPERLVTVRETRPQDAEPSGVSFANFDAWRTQTKSFEGGLAVCAFAGFNFTGRGEPLTLVGWHVSANYFDVMGVKPALGRFFRPDEEAPDKNQVVVISHSLWRRVFASSPEIIGQPLQIGLPAPCTVIGVAPEWLARTGDERDVWTPWLSGTWSDKASHYSQVWGRLKDGVTVAEAQAEMEVLAAQTAAGVAPADRWGVRVTPRLDFINRQWQAWLWTLLGGVGSVLLIACANVANLLIARGSVRQREIAVRAALGATRGRLMRQLLTESLVLAALGGAAGLLLSVWGLATLRRFAPEASTTLVTIDRLAYVELDGAKVALACGLTLATGVLFGFAPAWLTTRVDLRTAMSQGGRGSTGAGGGRLRRGLVVIEVALAVVMLATAGLFLRSFVRLSQADPGFVPERASYFFIDLPKVDRYAKGDQAVQFAEAVLGRLRNLPGVEAAGVTNYLGALRRANARELIIEGRPEALPGNAPLADAYSISPGYFRAMGMRVVRGRDFTEDDRGTGRRVAMINETFARTHFANENPIGRRVAAGKWEAAEIVGVVADASPGTTDEPMRAEIFAPIAQHATKTMFFVVRSRLPTAMLHAVLPTQVEAVDADQPIYRIETLTAVVERATGLRRFALMLLVVFSAVAAALAALGLYGVIAYSVSQRRVEIGIRIAIGAGMREIVGLVLGEGACLVIWGLIIGVGVSLASGHLIASRLFRTSAHDPLTLGGISAAFLLLAALACWLPARRAAKMDPLTALRAE